jgi:aryl-alcohol dehydrogenase-like predicted oxidoreductase
MGSDIVVATKIGHPRLETPGLSRLDRASLRADVCAGLDNLGVSSLDLVYLHRDDPSRPVEDLLGPLDEMRREGLLRHYGVSNWSAGRVGEAQLATKAAGWRAIVANQPEWSMAWRNPGSAASDLVQMDATAYRLHERTSLAATPYTSQAKGYFDKLLAGTLDAATTRAFHNPANAEVARTLNALAVTCNASVSSIALAVVLAAPFPTIPIIGSHTQTQIESSFRCLTIDLPDDVVARLLARRFGLRVGQGSADGDCDFRIGPARNESGIDNGTGSILS